MRYVPSLPPARIADLWDRLLVSGVHALRSAQAVGPRTLPPLVTHPLDHRGKPLRGQSERRHDLRLHGERRIYCRRIRHVPVLLDLRSGIERRRRAQRVGDPHDHVDIEA